MEYTINNADICELAHEYTVIECEDNIQIEEEHENGDIHYTEKAQAIFDEHYNRITSILGV